MRRSLFLGLTLLFGLVAKAQDIVLGDLLLRYEKEGYSFVYTTALVDEVKKVDWSGEVAISALRAVLREHELQLERLAGNQFSIQPLEVVVPRIKIESSPDTRPIDHIVVTASRYELQGDDVSSGHLLGAAELADNPSFGGDSLRIVHRLPGAATIGVTSKPNVRGGSDDELLVLFDGVELVEPFHLRDFQSMFSSFNPQTIQSIEFFTGGFPARYGNKMSGVLDIATQDSFDAPGGEIGISAYNLSALYFNETEDDRWLVSARRGNLDLVIRSEQGDPKYYDFYSRYTREIKGGRLKASVFVFDDDLSFTQDESTATSKVKNRYIWFEWERDKVNHESRTILSLGQIDSLREGRTFSEEDTEGFLIDDQTFDTISLKHLQQLKINDTLKFDFGGTYRSVSVDYKTTVQVEKDIVAEFLGQPESIDFGFDKKFDGASISLYSIMKYQPLPKLTLEMGLRLDRQTYAESDTQFSPRLALLYTINNQWDMRFSYGRFHQPHAIYELNTADGETSFSEPQQSDHYIWASEYRFGNDTKLVAEVFYKQIENLKPRYVNLFDPYVYLPELQQDRIIIKAEKAEARGFEVSYSGGSEVFEWNLNYAFSEVQDKEAGVWVDRRWDQTHTVNAFFNWYFDNWTVGVASAWHTGWATTALPQTLPADEVLDIPYYRNNDRLEDYATLDIKVAYDQELPNSNLKYFLEVTNIVNFTNKGGVDYEISEEDDLFFLEEIDVQPVFPLVTNIGIIWRF